MFSEDSTLHAVWAEILPSVQYSKEYRIPTPILAHSTYKNGRWEHVATHNYGHDITWSWADFVKSPDNAYYAAFNTWEREGVKINIVCIDLNDMSNSWQRDRLVFRGGYPQIAFSSKGKPLLAYTAGARADSTSQEKFDVGSVFVAHLDGERDSVLVSRSGMNSADYLRIAVGSDGIVHLVWSRSATDAADSHVLDENSYVYHTLSRDDGITWTTPETMASLLNVATINMLEGLNGELHLVIEAATDEWGGTLYYAYYDSAAWMDIQPIFIEGLTAEVALTVTDDGTLHLFTNYLPPDSPPEAYRPVYLNRPPLR